MNKTTVFCLLQVSFTKYSSEYIVFGHGLYYNNNILFDVARGDSLIFKASFGHGGIKFTKPFEHRRTVFENIDPPQKVNISLRVFNDEFAVPTVNVGDTVLRGARIAATAGRYAVPIYSSLTGTVCSVTREKIEIENDFSGDDCVVLPNFPKKLFESSSDEIISRIRLAGITMCGDGFPLWYYLKESVGAADELIINAVTDIPGVACFFSSVLKDPERFIGGVKIILKALGLRCATVAVDDSNSDFIHFIKNMQETQDVIDLKIVRSKYPQSDSRLLIYALGGPSLPMGHRPFEIGYCVVGVGECEAVYDAFVYGKQQLDVDLAVIYDKKRDAIFVNVPIGTQFSHVVGQIVKNRGDEYRVVLRGAVPRGKFVPDDVGVSASERTIEILKDNRVLNVKNTECIRCGRCVDVCPMSIMPLYLYKAVVNNNRRECVKFNIHACCGCGCCSYVCPSGLPLFENIFQNRIRR